MQIRREIVCWCLKHMPEVDPKTPSNQELLHAKNTEACEQLNSWIHYRTRSFVWCFIWFFVMWFHIFLERRFTPYLGQQQETISILIDCSANIWGVCYIVSHFEIFESSTRGHTYWHHNLQHFKKRWHYCGDCQRNYIIIQTIVKKRLSFLLVDRITAPPSHTLD